MIIVLKQGVYDAKTLAPNHPMTLPKELGLTRFFRDN